MISYEYIWNHIHSLWYHTSLWHSHTLYSCHHTQDTCHHIHCSWSITYSVLIIAHLYFVWYQNDYMYDIIWILCDIKNLFMTPKDCIHDITSTLSLTSHPLYTTWHTLYIWHHSHCNCDKTATVFLTLYSLYMTSQTMSEWQHNDSIWHDTQCICVINPLDWWHHNLCMYEITPTACMTP